MLKKDKQIFKDIRLSMFNYIQPEAELTAFLQHLIHKTNYKLIITDAGRTVVQHINLYKKNYGENWLKKIKWRSRHLAKFGYNLRAVDFCLEKPDKTFVTGDQLRNYAKEYSENNKIALGVGAGKNWLHVDVDRDEWTEWAYNI